MELCQHQAFVRGGRPKFRRGGSSARRRKSVVSERVRHSRFIAAPCSIEPPQRSAPEWPRLITECSDLLADLRVVERIGISKGSGRTVRIMLCLDSCWDISRNLLAISRTGIRECNRSGRQRR